MLKPLTFYAEHRLHLLNRTSGFTSLLPTAKKSWQLSHPKNCASFVKDVDFSGEAALIQRNLGLLWEIASDTFTFSVANDIKPFTRRGVLSTVNSVFDPLGFLAPVTILRRALLRETHS